MVPAGPDGFDGGFKRTRATRAIGFFASEPDGRLCLTTGGCAKAQALPEGNPMRTAMRMVSEALREHCQAESFNGVFVNRCACHPHECGTLEGEGWAGSMGGL